MGREIETPMSEFLRGGYEAITSRLDENSLRRLFIWLCLLFIKTHLKDRLLRAHLDPRHGQEKLADAYYWPEFHHVHAVARSPVAGIELAPDAVGSMAFFQMDDSISADAFDWIDLSDYRTIALRVGDLAVVSVLNDAGACAFGLRDTLAPINGPITTIHLREVAARMAVANFDLENRPSFGTLVVRGDPDHAQIVTEHDSSPRFQKLSHKKYGEVLAYALRDQLGHLEIDGERNPEAVRARLESGQVSFLFDHNGSFMKKIIWQPVQNTGASAPRSR
jgi:hypothetical protein